MYHVTSFNKNIVLVNKRLSYIIDKPIEVILRTGLACIYSEEELQIIINQCIPYALSGKEWTGKLSITTNNGIKIPTKHQSFSITNKEGRSIGVVTSIEDISEEIEITKRIASGKNLTETQRMLRAIIDSVPIGIFWKDRWSKYLGANRQYAHDVGLNSPGELIGKSDYELYPRETADICIENDKKFFESGQDLLSEKCVTTPEGERRWLTVNKTFIMGSDEASIILLGLYDDITETKKNQENLQRAIEQAEESNRAKSEFLSRMSHELKTPMNAIVGMTKIAKTAQDVEKMRYCLDKIDGASNYLLSMMNNILDMDKIAANKLELEERLFDLENMLQDILNIISVNAEKKRITLFISIDTDIPSKVVGDELRLSQVIMNLLSNSIKFTPNNGVVRLNIKRNIEYGEFSTRFEFIDSGTGISQEQIDNFFMPFEQSKNKIPYRFGAIGIGLSVSKRIIELMGGHIGATSEYNKGSKFYFTVNLKSYNCTHDKKI
jgi:PAS domain S-box-containing protein